jgi:hypothetical protein
VTTTYDYARGDRLVERNTYAYTAYEGRAFLEAWRASRTEALADLPEPAEQLRVESARVPTAPDAGGETTALLDSILTALETGAVHPALEALLQRFEVSKRVHGRYTRDWKPEDPKDYTDLKRYVRFAETLERAYARLADLRYLNALLKCNDTLVSLRSRLDEEQGARLARLLLAERDHVLKLDAPRT